MSWIRRSAFISSASSYLVVLAVPVDHPVLPVGADLQFKGSDVVGLLRLL